MSSTTGQPMSSKKTVTRTCCCPNLLSIYCCRPVPNLSQGKRPPTSHTPQTNCRQGGKARWIIPRPPRRSSVLSSVDSHAFPGGLRRAYRQSVLMNARLTERPRHLFSTGSQAANAHSPDSLLVRHFLRSRSRLREATPCDTAASSPLETCVLDSSTSTEETRSSSASTTSQTMGYGMLCSTEVGKSPARSNSKVSHLPATNTVAP